jgi:hypothetical protein
MGVGVLLDDEITAKRRAHRCRQSGAKIAAGPLCRRSAVERWLWDMFDVKVQLTGGSAGVTSRNRLVHELLIRC